MYLFDLEYIYHIEYINFLFDLEIKKNYKYQKTKF